MRKLVSLHSRLLSIRHRFRDKQDAKRSWRSSDYENNHDERNSSTRKKSIVGCSIGRQRRMSTVSIWCQPLKGIAKRGCLLYLDSWEP